MKLQSRFLVSIAVAAALSACGATPERIEVLEEARNIVSAVESSPRAGVAARNIADAHESLEEANRQVESKGKRADIDYAAQNAILHAQIAQERILTVQAQEQIEHGKEQRQTVLLSARERDVRAGERDVLASEQQASDARQAASDSQERADSLEEELADLRLQKTDRGLVLTLGDVLFDSGESTLRSGAYGTMDRLANALRDVSGRSVAIEGHTDSVGADAMNQSLSERRAQAVQMALLQRGVPNDQVSSLGKGEHYPIASNENVGGRQQNRRVELIFAENRTRSGSEQE